MRIDVDRSRAEVAAERERTDQIGSPATPRERRAERGSYAGVERRVRLSDPAPLVSRDRAIVEREQRATPPRAGR